MRSHPSRLAALILAGLGAAALLAGCGGSSSGSSGRPSISKYASVKVTPGPATVDAEDNFFDPRVLKVDKGTKVTFDNTGGNIHDVVTVDGGGFGIGAQKFRPGDKKTFTFDDTGVFRYYCSIHGTPTSGMTGTIVVVP